jgi:hypothetical protein
MAQKPTQVSDVTKTCVFLKLTLSRLGDKRGVPSDQFEVDANKELVRARKIIFRSHKFDAIRSLDGEIRRYVRDICLPFEPGLHMVPLGIVEKIETQLLAYSARRAEAVAEFVKIWPELMSEAKPELRALFDEGDYQTSVADAFEMGWQFLMFTAPTELESINSDIFKAERDKMQTRMREAWEEARFVLRETCLSLVTHLREQLENDVHGAPKRMSASTVKHLWDFISSEPLRNVTGDQELSSYCDQMRQLLTGVDRDALKEADGLRARVRAELQQVEVAITGTIQVAPKRRIRANASANRED